MTGANFERKIRTQLFDYSFATMKLQQAASWGGSSVKNPCDFVTFKDNIPHMIEAKVVNPKVKSLTKSRMTQLEDMAKFRLRNPNMDIFFVIRYECLPRKEMHKIAHYDDIIEYFENSNSKSINHSLPWLQSWEEWLEKNGKKKS